MDISAKKEAVIIPTVVTLLSRSHDYPRRAVALMCNLITCYGVTVSKPFLNAQHNQCTRPVFAQMMIAPTQSSIPLASGSVQQQNFPENSCTPRIENMRMIIKMSMITFDISFIDADILLHAQHASTSILFLEQLVQVKHLQMRPHQVRARS